MAKKSRLRMLPHPFRVQFATDAVPDQVKDHIYDEDSGRRPGFILAWHRTDTEVKQCALANEWICAHIAQRVGLDFPPFGLTRSDDPEHPFYFSELDFNSERDSIPRMCPDACVQKLSFNCTGILLFDILIANPDRRPANLEVDHTYKPKRIWVFDNEQALFGPIRADATARLATFRDRLGLAYLDRPDCNYHCFLERLSTAKHFAPWFTRFDELPDWFLKSICADTKLFGMSDEERFDAFDFLAHRRNTLRSIVKANRSLFTEINWTPDGELRTPEGEPL